VVFERRHEELDARDRTLIAALQRQHTLPTALHVSWQPATSDPLLWLADIAAGAASLAEAGDNRYWSDLAAAFTAEKFRLT
jgi:hypothetical protein